MFSNILSELSGSADIAGKAVVERYSSVCVQVGTVVVDDGRSQISRGRVFQLSFPPPM